MALTLTDTQKCTLTLTFVDAAGNPAVPPATPAWSVADTALLAVSAAADGLSAVITTVGPLGTTQVSAVTGTLTGVLDVAITGDVAATEVITASTPEPK